MGPVEPLLAELRELWPLARSAWDRERAFIWLGSAPEDPSVTATLRRAATGADGSNGDVRSAALDSLVQLIGVRAADEVRTCFSSRALDLRLRSLRHATALDVDLGDAFVSWARRRLSGRARLQAWDYQELPNILAHAIRRGSVPRLFGALDRAVPSLDALETEQLDAAWPAGRRRRFASSHDPHDGPDPTAVAAWCDRARLNLADPLTPEQIARAEELWVDDLRDLVVTLRRRETSTRPPSSSRRR